MQKKKRITPACAGNRCMRPCSAIGQEDHPRVCGEQGGKHRCRVSLHGSPPRVRGTGRSPAVRLAPWGITPACAGNSGREHGAAATCEDHPRVCGEQGASSISCFSPHGSPPRVRGTDHDVPHGKAAAGITPACAGNRPLRKQGENQRQDHPRVCGEQLRLQIAHGKPVGSPPRVRGTVAYPCVAVM